MIKILMYQSYESYQNMGIACSEPDKIFLRAIKIFSRAILLLGTRLELVCKSQRDSNFWIIISVHINARIRHIEVSPFHLQLLDLLGVYSNDHIIYVPCPQLFTSRGASLQSTCTSPGKVDEHDITYIMLTMHVSTLGSETQWNLRLKTTINTR